MDPLFSILLGVGVLLAVVYVVGSAVRKALQQDSAGGFLWALTHPNAIMDWANQRQAALDEASEAVQDWSDEQIAEAVRRYVFEPQSESDAHFDYRVLRSLGTRTHEPVAAILADPTLRTTLIAAEDKANLPIDRACDLLTDTSDPRYVSLLEPYVGEASRCVRKAVARNLGSLGAIEGLPHLRKLLADEDEYVRSCAMSGLRVAATDGRLHPQLGSELYGDLLQLIETDFNADEVIGLLLQFDRPRTEALLTGDRYVSVNFGNVHRVLRGLEQEKVLVPRDRLRGILHRLAGADLACPPNASIVSSTLKLLAMHNDAADLQHFERYADCLEERVARGAVAGLLALAGLEGFEKLWEGLDYEDLTLIQRRYIAVRNMDAEICNGGLSQYFFNTAGDLWRDALDGLRVMGMSERATLLTEAVAMFGATPPSEHRQKRMGQLSKVSQANTVAFHALDKRYYASKETVVTALARYVLANADDFR